MAGRRRGPKLSPVEVYVDQSIDEGAGPAACFVGHVFDVTPGRADEERWHRRDVVIPLGRGNQATFKLPPGEYLIEALAPGGDLLDQRVSIREGRAPPRPVRLGKRRSLAKRLGWQVSSGNIDKSVLASETHALLRLSKEDKRELKAFGYDVLTFITIAMAVTTIVAWTADFVLQEDSYTISNSTIPDVSPIAESLQWSSPRGQLSWGLPLWLLTLAAAGLAAFRLARLIRPAPAPPMAAAPAQATAPAEAASMAVPATETDAPALEASRLAIDSGLVGWELVRSAVQGRTGIDALLRNPDCRTSRLRRSSHSSGFDLFEIADETPFPPPAPSIGRGGFALIPVAGATGEIVTLPLPWHLRDLSNAVFEIAVSNSDASTFGTASTIRDAQVSPILGYLSAGRLGEASLLVRQATALLCEKIEFPLPAALGAYVLLRTCTNIEDDWRRWIDRLCHVFPNFSDGAILHGWSLLQCQRGIEDARDSFIEAYERGLPTYSEGIRMLQEGLSVFADESEGNERLRRAIEGADMLARRCNPSQAFTTIRIASHS